MEDRAVAQATVGLQRFHHLLEGQILMGIGGKCPFTNLREQVGHTGGITRGDAQSQGINEEADLVLKLMARTVSDRSADDNVILTTEPGEDDAPGGQHGHKQGGVMALSEFLKRR